MRTGLSLAIIAHAACCAAALAQPAQQAAPTPEWRPFITEGDERLWTLRWKLAASRQYAENIYELNPPVYRRAPFNVPPASQIGRHPFPPSPIQTIDVRAATFVAPLQWRTGSSEAYPGMLEGSLNFNAATMTDDWIGQPGGLPDLINVEWSVRIADDEGNSLVPIVAQPERVDIDFRLPVRVFETILDEPRAMAIDWPSAWPAWTQPARDPQPYIPSSDPFVGALLNTWTNNAPHSMPPARLAKFLAARVIEEAQTGLGARAFWPEPDTNRGYPYAVTRHDPPPYLRGIDVQDKRIFLRQTLYTPRIREVVEGVQANEAVITNLYVALLRAAGLPARVIVAVVPAEAELERIGGRDSRVNDDRRAPLLRYWAEFYLWDDAAQRGQWIPVDVVRQRIDSSRPPPLDRPWRYFGNHDELDEAVPLTSVYSALDATQLTWVPAVWGWRPDPQPTFLLDPVLRFEAIGAPRRAGDPFGDIGVKRGN